MHSPWPHYQFETLQSSPLLDLEFVMHNPDQGGAWPPAEEPSLDALPQHLTHEAGFSLTAMDSFNFWDGGLDEAVSLPEQSLDTPEIENRDWQYPEQTASSPRPASSPVSTDWQGNDRAPLSPSHVGSPALSDMSESVVMTAPRWTGGTYSTDFAPLMTDAECTYMEPQPSTSTQNPPVGISAYGNFSMTSYPASCSGNNVPLQATSADVTAPLATVLATSTVLNSGSSGNFSWPPSSSSAGLSISQEDISLAEATLHAEATGTETPKVKEELRYQIQQRRRMSGLEPAVIEEHEAKPEVLTHADERRRERRRDSNRRAATKLRNKKKRAEEELKDNHAKLERENSDLREEVRRLSSDNEQLEEVLRSHANDPKCQVAKTPSPPPPKRRR